jgi:hypothetical protein
MYWYKSTLFLTAAAVLFLTSGLQSCKPDIKETGANMKYFDIQGFFKAESARLAKSNKPILKTIKHNGVTESKKVLIINWDTELSLFSESDINKPAWKNSYSVQADSNIIIYMAKEPELITREVLIKLVAGKVKYMMIINANDAKKHSINNLFYKYNEKLSYFPDSLYLIQRAQTIRLLGTNKYDISGFLN